MSWEITGNSGTDPSKNFLGTTDEQPLVIKTDGVDAIHIDPHQHIGIGLGPCLPGAKLHVRSFHTNPVLGPSVTELVLDRLIPSVVRGKPASKVVTDLVVVDGKVGIGTDKPKQRLSVAGMIESTLYGFKYPDGSIQTSATLKGDTGAQGPKGDTGAQGPKGDTGAQGAPGISPPPEIILDTSLEKSGAIRLTTDTSATTNPSSPIIALQCVADHADWGYVAVLDGRFIIRAGIFIDPNPTNFGRSVVAADLKSFRVPNPNQPETDIVYACIEGPEAAVYARGTAHLSKGEGSISLPDHFVSVANFESMTIQITPLSSDSQGLAVVAKKPGSIVVKELHNGTGSYDFDWEAKCVRKGYEDYQVIHPHNEMEMALFKQNK